MEFDRHVLRAVDLQRARRRCSAERQLAVGEVAHEQHVVLAREADWLPPWRELLMACRRLETRGEIRGGRFVAGFSGEQFALPEAVTLLRSVRGADKSGLLVTVSGTDPLNLAGIVLPGVRVAAIYSNRVLYRDGIAIAALIAGDVQYFEKVDQETAWAMRNTLLRTHAPPELASLL